MNITIPGWINGYWWKLKVVKLKLRLMKLYLKFGGRLVP